MAFAVDEPYGGTPANAPEGWTWGDPVPPEARWLHLASAVTAFLQKLDETPMDELISVATFADTAVIDQQLIKPG